MFIYHSEQNHIDVINGIPRKKIQKVDIKGNHGYKMVEITNKSGTKHSKKSLTLNEIKNIQNQQYIPGLFRTCEHCIMNQTLSHSKSRKSHKSHKSHKSRKSKRSNS